MAQLSSYLLMKQLLLVRHDVQGKNWAGRRPIASPAGLADASRDQRREKRQYIAAQRSGKDRGQRQQVDAALYVAIRGSGPMQLGLRTRLGVTTTGETFPLIRPPTGLLNDVAVHPLADGLLH